MDEMKGALTELRRLFEIHGEWKWDSTDYVQLCPVCRAERKNGHHKLCEIEG